MTLAVLSGKDGAGVNFAVDRVGEEYEDVSSQKEKLWSFGYLRWP